jgi:hypothetical protein
VKSVAYDRCNAAGLNCLALEAANSLKISASFSIIANGWGVCVSGRHSKYPSTEINFDSGSSTHTIRRYDQIPGAVLALGAPDSRFGCEIADLPGLSPPPSSGPIV